MASSQRHRSGSDHSSPRGQISAPQGALVDPLEVLAQQAHGASDLRVAEPQVAEPQVAEPQAAEPQAVEPQANAQQPPIQERVVEHIPLDRQGDESFVNWINNNQEPRAVPGGANCWETLLAAANLSGALGAQEWEQRVASPIADGNASSRAVAWDVLGGQNATPLTANAQHQPTNLAAGQALFFGGTSHVAMASDAQGGVRHRWGNMNPQSDIGAVLEYYRGQRPQERVAGYHDAVSNAASSRLALGRRLAQRDGANVEELGDQGLEQLATSFWAAEGDANEVDLERVQNNADDMALLDALFLQGLDGEETQRHGHPFITVGTPMWMA